MNTTEQWQKALQEEGYEHHLRDFQDCQKLKKFSRLWRRIFKITKIDPIASQKLRKVCEVGCGGGKHLIPFALNSWQSVGIDCSKEVLERAANFSKEVSRVCRQNILIELILGDFLTYRPKEKEEFDLVYQIGVLEHFLDTEERLLALKKMFKITKPGGYVISIVPSGIHPLRAKMKKENLGGYNIPEIDYSPELISQELKNCGGKEIQIFGHNIFNYIFLKGSEFKFFKKIFYLVWQAIPLSILPKKFVYRHSDALIGITKKP